MVSLDGGTGSRPYVPLLEIASGGMGTVHVALRREGAFSRTYAVKRIHRHLRDDAAFLGMFLDEARISGLLRHPNVVSVLDVGEDEDGPFLVMDYVEGITVMQLMTQLAREEDLIPLQLGLRIAAQAARGLHAAHELRGHDGAPMQLVHRDVSPQNLIVGYDGIVRVTDFGVAKALGRLTKTESGILKGKLGYAAPEQLRFEDVDARSDLFSLGVVLYEMLAGGRLYGTSGTVPAPRRILTEPPPDVGEVRADVPPELVELLFAMLAKKPDERPASAADVAQRLEALDDALAAAEGRTRLDAFVTGRFGARREQRASEIEKALRQALAVDVGERPPSPARRRGVPRLALAALVATAVGLGTAAAVALGGREDASPVDAVAAPPIASDSTRQTAPAPSAHAERARDGDGDTMADRAHETPAASLATLDAGTASREEDAATLRMRERRHGARRRTTRQREPAGEMDGRRIWQWD